MEIFIETMIYLLAVIGLILTCISFCEMFSKEKYINNTYRIYKAQKNHKGKVSVYIKLSDMVDEELEDEMLQRIKEENNLNIIEVADEIYIENE